MSNSAMPDELSLIDVVRFYRRHWMLVALFMLLIGVLAVMLRKPKFSNSVVLFIPTEVKAEIKSRLGTPGDYRRVLEAPETKSELQRRLASSQGPAAAKPDFALRSAMSPTNNFVIEASADASDPERALAVANEWGTVFLDQTGLVAKDAVKDYIATQQGQQAQHKARVADLNTQKETLDAERKQARDTLYRQFDEKFKALHKDTEDTLLATKCESLDAQAACAEDLRKALSPVEKTLSQKTFELDSQQKVYAAMFASLAASPRQSPREPSLQGPVIAAPTSTIAGQTHENSDTGAAVSLLAVKNDFSAQLTRLEKINAEAEAARAEKVRLEETSKLTLRRISDRFDTKESLAKAECDMRLQALQRDQTAAVTELGNQFQRRGQVIDDALLLEQKGLTETAFELQRLQTNENKLDVQIQPAVPSGSQASGPGVIVFALLGMFGGLLVGTGLGTLIEILPKALKD